MPFVRRCALDLGDGQWANAMIVNINVLGAYVTHDVAPRLGQPLRVRFSVPGNVRELDLHGSVAWINHRQAHPVHSLPPGFGVRFADLDADARRRIEALVTDYMKRYARR